MAARRDDWLQRAQQRNAADLGTLLPELLNGPLAALEGRFLALTHFPTTPAIGATAAEFCRTLPIRAREHLAAATAAAGAAWLHQAPSSSFLNVPKPKSPNAALQGWHANVTAALHAALQHREKPPFPEKRPAEPSPLPTSPRLALHKAWLERAARIANADLPALLELLPTGPATDLTERAVALLAFPVDARIGDAAAQLIDRAPVRFSAEVPLFTVLALVLCIHGDQRHAPTLERLAKKIPSLAWAVGALPKHSPSAAPTPTKRASSGPSSEDEFLHFIAQQPDDDSRVAVFTDWLLERGLPRGEFMALQRAGRPLTPAEQKRVAALQKQHGRAWVRKLWRGPLRDSAVFRNGVLTEAIFLCWTQGDVPSPDEPQLATLERLRIGGGTNLNLGAFLAAAPLPSLRDLCAPPWLLRQTPNGLLARLHTLGLERTLASDGDVVGVLSKPLPELHTLRLIGQHWDETPWLEGLKVLTQLGRLEVETRRPAVWSKLATRVDALTVIDLTDEAKAATHYSHGKKVRGRA